MGSNPPPEPIYRQQLEAHLADSALVEVSVQARLGDSREAIEIEVTVDLGDLLNVPSPNTTFVRAIVYEDGVPLDVRVFDHVVRAAGAEAALPGIGAGIGAASNVTLTLPYEATWDPMRLRVIAWVQDDSDQTVLNAGSAMLTDPTPIDPMSWGRIKSRY